MATLVELVASIVESHASASPLSTDDLLQEIQKVYNALKALDTGEVALPVEEAKPAITAKESIKKNEVICLICGKGGMKTLARHLSNAHGMKQGDYKKKFGISAKQALVAKSFSESRRKLAKERNLAGNLAKAREVRAANIKAKTAEPVKKAARVKKLAKKG